MITLVIVLVPVLALMAYGAFVVFVQGMGRSTIPDSPPPTGPPDRYAVLPVCTSISARISGLPPLVTREEGFSPDGGPSFVTSCSWYEYGKPSRSVSLYLSASDVQGSGSGEDTARGRFGGVPGENFEQIPGLAVAAAFYDEPGRPEQCWIKLYQGNVFAQLSVNGDPNKATCRASVKKLAEGVTEALN
ncbi:hypothetical protein [Amycolatopsis sp. NPDC059657]|uniref:hypothetical protein n=1 Tax=Amycolatopsis sp. NPDC059657 TaxID=3346899 RepID=UPI0036719280